MGDAHPNLVGVQGCEEQLPIKLKRKDVVATMHCQSLTGRKGRGQRRFLT